MITLRSKVFDILKDGAWHSPQDMAEQLKTTARAVSSRIRDLRLLEYGNYRIKAKRIEGNNFEYQMVNPPKIYPTIWDGTSGGIRGTDGTTGGWITISSGTATSSGGAITIIGGSGGTISGGGAITISGGSSTRSGNGGTITLTGGSSNPWSSVSVSRPSYNYAPYVATFSTPVASTVSVGSDSDSGASWSRNYEPLYNYSHNYEPLI